MRKVVGILITICFVACSIKPAPITSLDVKQTVSSLEGEAKAVKKKEITTQIEERRTYLKGEKKHLDNVLLVIAIATLSPVLIGGPTYLIQLPARKTIKREYGTLSEMEKVLLSL